MELVFSLVRFSKVSDDWAEDGAQDVNTCNARVQILEEFFFLLVTHCESLSQAQKQDSVALLDNCVSNVMNNTILYRQNVSSDDLQL